MANEKDELSGINYAAIDIGSNAVRLLIKHLDEDSPEVKFSKVLMVRVPLRLGFDVFSKNRISEKREKNMIRLMKSYSYLMKIYDVKDYRACATSAMRDSKNGPQIIKRVEKESGIHIEIIDGQEEAQIVYNNYTEHMKGGDEGNYMYVDVGGGSTEINLLSEGKLICSRSYNIGTVRILNNAVKDGEWDRLKNDMTAFAALYPNTNIIGSGGNINRLYRMIDSRDKKRKRITVSSLQDMYNALRVLTVDQRMAEYDLKPDRADVIVPAGDIFLTIAGIIKAEYIYVPTIGLSDGVIDGLYARDFPKMENEQ